MYLEPADHVVPIVPTVTRADLLTLRDHAHAAVDVGWGFPAIRAWALTLAERLLEDWRTVSVADIDIVLVSVRQLVDLHAATGHDPNAELRAADVPIWEAVRAKLMYIPADTVPTVRDRVHSRRLAEGISQRAVAQACGVTLRTVARWERGDTYPTRAHAVILADMLGGTVIDYLTQ